ncbi:MAG: CD225/dispanin family protein [Planctomycetia bacterium]|nr:CD225/dispanin family protein [Planctomycetia bacterium]
MANWFYYINDRKYGPVHSNFLQKLATSGAITPHTIVESELGLRTYAKNVESLEFPSDDRIPESPSVLQNPPYRKREVPVSSYAPPSPITNNMFCQRCGAQVIGNFCAQCGSPTGLNHPPIPADPSLNRHKEVNIPSSLAWCIFTTIFCCPIFGIIAIIYTIQTNSKIASGAFPEAQKSANLAHFWAQLAFYTPFILILISIFATIFSS